MARAPFCPQFDEKYAHTCPPNGEDNYQLVQIARQAQQLLSCNKCGRNMIGLWLYKVWRAVPAGWVGPVALVLVQKPDLAERWESFYTVMGPEKPNELCMFLSDLCNLNFV